MSSLNDAVTGVAETEGAFRAAIVVRDQRHASSEEAVRASLLQAEVDTRSNPALLELIGWGPKKPKSPVAPPGEPRDFGVVKQGRTWVEFDWKNAKTGGKPRIYRLERRQQPAGGGDFGDWIEIGNFIKTHARATEQPRGIQMEYHVVAINSGGETVSGVVDVVL